MRMANLARTDYNSSNFLPKIQIMSLIGIRSSPETHHDEDGAIVDNGGQRH